MSADCSSTRGYNHRLFSPSGNRRKPPNVESRSHSKSKEVDFDIWTFEEIPTAIENPTNDTGSNSTSLEGDIAIDPMINPDIEDNFRNCQLQINTDLFDQTGSNPSTNPQPGDRIEFVDPYIIVRAQIMPKR